MSPRNKKLRKVLNPPPIKGFKPYGPEVNDLSGNEPILLHFEEYEALRLCDYDKYNHHQASVIMGVSRPTFTRIYALVRQKIAMAFAEGKQIAIDGGKVYFDSDCYQCLSCKCYFNNPFKESEISSCPLCGSAKVSSFYIASTTTDTREIDSCFDKCICPSCGYEATHQQGTPCSTEVCPNCNAKMRRKGRN
ncbi:MAG TPA: DUF134 domain-containing protein [Bacteroidetes bacterium]|nr:DUF134 domain-containing protein [Bacteroidota bacterium]